MKYIGNSGLFFLKGNILQLNNMLGTSSQVIVLFIFLVRVFCLEVSKIKQQYSA